MEDIKISLGHRNDNKQTTQEGMLSFQYGGELELKSKDTKVIDERTELIQNIKIEVITIEGDVWYDLEFGWSLYEFLHRPIDDMLKLELHQRIKSKLSRRDEIEKNTIDIKFVELDDGLLIKIKLVILGEETDLTISLDRLNVVVED